MLLTQKSDNTVHVSGYKNCYGILNDVETFSAPYDSRMSQLGQGHHFFPGIANGPQPNADSAHKLLDLVNKKDLAEDLPKLVSETIAKFLTANTGLIEWQTISEAISATVFIDYFGLGLTDKLTDNCQRLFDWLFSHGSKSFTDLPRDEQQGILRAKQEISTALTDALENTSPENDSASGSIIARAVKLKNASAYSTEELVDVLIGLLLAFCPQLNHSLRLMPTLLERRFLVNKIYQACSVKDTDGLAKMLGGVNELNDQFATPNLSRISSGDYSLKRSWLPDINIKQGDEVWLSINEKEFAEKETPATIKYNPDAPAENFFKYGFEPHPTFGRALTLTALSAGLVGLFSTRRIKGFVNGQLELEPLPENPSAYHFEILGSSPPWAVAEEQIWLLDSCGIKDYLQFNILSVYEFVRLLIKKNTSFYDSNKFYAAYDRNHQILFGSSYSGGGLETVRMGDGFYNFASGLSMNPVKSASQFTHSEDYEAVFGAYSTIRSNYYTWAYFTAFLDKGYGFTLKALLVFQKKPGFQPLTPIENLIMMLVIGLVALIQILPLLSVRINGFFKTTVTENIKNIRKSVDTLDNILADGRQYIFGDEFTAADIHVCANMINLIVPDEVHGGGVLPPLEQYPPNYRKFVEELRQTTTGQYVLRIYRDHRIFNGVTDLRESKLPS